MSAERNQEFRFMRPLGAKKTHVHCQNQRCAICRPCWPAKGGKVAESRAAEKQASRDADEVPEHFWDLLMTMKPAEEALGEGPGPFV